jgi:prevent-host-death family protein
MADTITLHTLKADQKRIVARVKRGETITVTERGTPVLSLVPATQKHAPSWDELMAPVRKARAQSDVTCPNPVLEERNRRRR